MKTDRTMSSRYMQWAKTCSTARFNLATSGVLTVARSEFPLQDAALEITAPGGYGYPPLLQRLSKYTGAAEQCIVTAIGTSMANHLAFAAVLERGDEVLIEQPGYGPLIDVAEYLGATVKRLPRRAEARFAIDPAELDQMITSRTKLIVLTNLHNPSGALLDAETLREVGRIAHDAGTHVLVDEVYLEMLADAPRAFPLGEGFGDANPFIITSSLTKAYGLSGLRCGWILASPDLAKRIWLLNDLFGVNAAHLAERASVVAFDHLGQFRQRASALLRENGALLDSFLDSRPDLDCVRPPAGTVVFPKLHAVHAAGFVKFLRERYEVSVVPGEFFDAPDHFRIGIGGETAELRGGLERMAAALDSFHDSSNRVISS